MKEPKRDYRIWVTWTADDIDRLTRAAQAAKKGFEEWVREELLGAAARTQGTSDEGRDTSNAPERVASAPLKSSPAESGDPESSAPRSAKPSEGSEESAD